MTHTHTVDDYEILVRYDVEAGEFTAQVIEMPGVILGAVTAEAALSTTRWMLGEILADCAREGDTPPPPGSRPPARYEEALPEPLVKAKPAARAAASYLGRLGGAVKSVRKAQSARRNGLLGAKYGKLGGRPKKKAATHAAA